MATSKTSKASKTAAKKGGRKTAENSPQMGVSGGKKGR